MNISEQWLREWVSPELNTEDLAHQLTMAGLEVEAIDPVAGQTSAAWWWQKYHQCRTAPGCRQVAGLPGKYAGGETVQIVCGAPNARAGLKAPLATGGRGTAG